MGLPNIRRNTDAFVITSETNCGTALVMTVHVS
jgi:hypothetical protein